MPSPRVLVALISILVAGVAADAAHADEAYVCGATRVVYVKPGELERMKQQDPCIASYYGLSVESGPTVPPAKSAEKVPSIAASAPARPKLRALTEPGLDIEAVAPRSSNRATTSGAQDPVLRMAPVKARETDGRRVHILNAEPGSAAWLALDH
jgi:hypothetical protein